MKVIYENKVKASGIAVEEFKDAGMFIIFGEKYLVIDGQEYKITCVGYEAPITLKGLGHCTFNFNGATEAELPGTIYCEEKPMPEIGIGSVIKIIEK